MEENNKEIIEKLKDMIKILKIVKDNHTNMEPCSFLDTEKKTEYAKNLLVEFRSTLRNLLKQKQTNKNKQDMKIEFDDWYNIKK